MVLFYFRFLEIFEHLVDSVHSLFTPLTESLLKTFLNVYRQKFKSSILSKEGVKMDKGASIKIATLALFIHGLIEIAGAVMLLVLPMELIAGTGFQFTERLAFSAALSAIFGLSRLVAGYLVWSLKKWGIAFGIILSTVTIIEAPSVYPFGIMDLLLSIIVLGSLLYSWFHEETV